MTGLEPARHGLSFENSEWNEEHHHLVRSLHSIGIGIIRSNSRYDNACQAVKINIFWEIQKYFSYFYQTASREIPIMAQP